MQSSFHGCKETEIKSSHMADNACVIQIITKLSFTETMHLLNQKCFKRMNVCCLCYVPFML